MCNFFSCIVKKDKTVIWEEGFDNHHELLEKYNIPDNTDQQALMNFARIEILPPDNKDGVFEKDLKKWDFKIDENYTPDWFSEAHKEKCYDALTKCLSIIIFDNREIESIKSKKGIYIRNCKIEKIINSQVKNMSGNSIVECMYDNSIVKNMYDNSIVECMYGNSIVECMYGNSIVKYMYDNSIVKNMSGNSIVECMYDNSIVNSVTSKDCKFNYDENAIVICRYNGIEIYSKNKITLK